MGTRKDVERAINETNVKMGFMGERCTLFFLFFIFLSFFVLSPRSVAEGGTVYWRTVVLHDLESH